MVGAVQFSFDCRNKSFENILECKTLGSVVSLARKKASPRGVGGLDAGEGVDSGCHDAAGVRRLSINFGLIRADFDYFIAVLK